MSRMSGYWISYKEKTSRVRNPWLNPLTEVLDEGRPRGDQMSRVEGLLINRHSRILATTELGEAAQGPTTEDSQKVGSEDPG